jgi:hypothetical protein
MSARIHEHGARQVTVQPQERAPEVGRPRVPLRRVKQPGEPPPETDDPEPEKGDEAASTGTEPSEPEH